MSDAPHPTLRAWRVEDFPAYVLLHSDAQIVYWLGGTSMGTSQMRTGFDHMRTHLDQHGWGMWAIVDAADSIVGAAGLQPIPEGIPGHPGIEAACRLDTTQVGKGLVTTPMRAVMPWAFAHIPNVQEIIAYTSRTNTRSQAVMNRVGFKPDPARDFDHPALPDGHPLRPHVTYTMKRNDPAAQHA